MIQRHAFDQSDYGVLACAIGRVALSTLCASIRSNRDKPAGALHQVWQRTFCQKEHPFEIHRDDTIEAGLIHVNDRTDSSNTRTSDHISDSIACPFDFADNLAQMLTLCYISLELNWSGSFFAHCGSRRRQPFDLPIDKSDF